MKHTWYLPLIVLLYSCTPFTPKYQLTNAIYVPPVNKAAYNTCVTAIMQERIGSPAYQDKRDMHVLLDWARRQCTDYYGVHKSSLTFVDRNGERVYIHPDSLDAEQRHILHQLLQGKRLPS